MQFSNTTWWRAAQDRPARPAQNASWRGGFFRSAAIPLARATVMLAWHTLRARPQDASLLGVNAPVAQIIATLSWSHIDRIVERQFEYLRPRWDDRPAIWRNLLLAARSNDFRKMLDFDLYTLQLTTGELWA